MSVFRGDDKEIDFEEEDTRNQYPDLYETEEEEEREEEDEEFCHYCGEPLEDGLCSAACKASADDEGRDEDIDLSDPDREKE